MLNARNIWHLRPATSGNQDFTRRDGPRSLRRGQFNRMGILQPAPGLNDLDIMVVQIIDIQPVQAINFLVLGGNQRGPVKFMFSFRPAKARRILEMG